MYKDCNEVIILLPWFANGSLDAKDKMIILTHMARCERCRKELVTLVHLNNALKLLGEKESELDFKMNLFADIKSEILNNKEIYNQINKERTAGINVGFNGFSPLKIPALLFESIRNAYRLEFEKVYRTVEPVVSDLKKYAYIVSAAV